jgi:hypothetical protein
LTVFCAHAASWLPKPPLMPLPARTVTAWLSKNADERHRCVVRTAACCCLDHLSNCCLLLTGDRLWPGTAASNQSQKAYAPYSTHLAVACDGRKRGWNGEGVPLLSPLQQAGTITRQLRQRQASTMTRSLKAAHQGAKRPVRVERLCNCWSEMSDQFQPDAKAYSAPMVLWFAGYNSSSALAAQATSLESAASCSHVDMHAKPAPRASQHPCIDLDSMHACMPTPMVGPVAAEFSWCSALSLFVTVKVTAGRKQKGSAKAEPSLHTQLVFGTTPGLR